jgi:hypothetical protein
MKVVAANGKKKVVMNRKEWEAIGKQAGWNDMGGDAEPLGFDRDPEPKPSIDPLSLPGFLQERISAMPEESRQSFLASMDQEWVDSQVAAHELMKGIEEGKWTMDDIRALAAKGQ